MENLNLKEAVSKVINDKKKIVTTITVVDDGESASALIAGEDERLLTVLAGAMIEKPEFKQLIGRAYLAATMHANAKEN